MTSTIYDQRLTEALAYYRTIAPTSDEHEQHLFATGYAAHLEDIDPTWLDLPLPTPAEFALEHDITELSTA